MFNFGFGGGFPGGMGGMPGGHSHGHGHGRGRQEVDNSKFYVLLGIEKDASETEIKKGFRKQAMQHHPDKGGDPEKFKEISRAYETLSDPEKKALYDQYGEEGLTEGGGGGGAGGMDIFDILGGGMFGDRSGFRGGAPRGKPRGEDIKFPLKVTLEDMYNGARKKLRLTRNIICTQCSGQGGKSVTMCRDCKGQGVRVSIRQIGPGMVQQMQSACHSCQGKGQVIPEKDKCKKCNGEKTVKDKKTIEVFVVRGMKHGERITFNGEADEEPGTTPGDVIVTLEQADHAVFKREGLNLVIKKSITLVEALTGFNFYVKHLDGRVLNIKSDPGVVYQSGDLKCVQKEGMPYPSNFYERGNLFVQLQVVFPASLDAAQKAALRQCLPAPAPQTIPPCKRKETRVDDDGMELEYEVDDVPEDHTLTNIDIQAEKEAAKRYNATNASQYDEDEQQSQPGCRSQ